MSYETLAEKLDWIEKSGLSRLGNCWVMRCYFHDEVTPSMAVMPMLGTFKCFSCGKTGNLDEIQYENIRQ